MDDLPNALRNLESYEPLESELSDAQKQKSRLEAYAEIRHGFKLILASNAVYIDEMENGTTPISLCTYQEWIKCV